MFLVRQNFAPVAFGSNPQENAQVGTSLHHPLPRDFHREAGGAWNLGGTEQVFGLSCVFATNFCPFARACLGRMNFRLGRGCCTSRRSVMTGRRVISPLGEVHTRSTFTCSHSAKASLPRREGGAWDKHHPPPYDPGSLETMRMSLQNSYALRLIRSYVVNGGLKPEHGVSAHRCRSGCEANGALCVPGLSLNGGLQYLGQAPIGDMRWQ